MRSQLSLISSFSSPLLSSPLLPFLSFSQPRDVIEAHCGYCGRVFGEGLIIQSVRQGEGENGGEREESAREKEGEEERETERYTNTEKERYLVVNSKNNAHMTKNNGHMTGPEVTKDLLPEVACEAEADAVLHHNACILHLVPVFVHCTCCRECKRATPRLPSA